MKHEERDLAELPREDLGFDGTGLSGEPADWRERAPCRRE